MTDADGTVDGAPSGSDPAGGADLRARVDLLAAENSRLREQYEQARRATRRRTAAGLAAVGAVAAAGGVALPAAQTVLFAIAATGLFAAVLVVGLAPSRSVAADTATAVYDARARHGAALVADLGLAAERVFVPTGAPGGEDPVRLFVPQHREFAVPDVEPGAPLVATPGDERATGVLVAPTGAGLYREFRSWTRLDAHPDAAVVAEGVADALGVGFDLVESVHVDVAPDEELVGDDGGTPAGGARSQKHDPTPAGRATFAVAGSTLGPVDRFDHPVASLAGVALAAELSVAVAVTVRPTEDDRADYLVTCRWPASGGKV